MQEAKKINGTPRASKHLDTGSPDYAQLLGLRVLPEHLLRPLTAEEIEAVRIYREYFEEYGQAVGSEKVGTLLRANASVGDFSDQNLKKLFRGLFKSYLGDDEKDAPDISYNLALKRLAGIGTDRLSRNECLECIRWVHEQVSGSNPKVLPTSDDMKKFYELKTVVPSVGLPVPSFATILRKVGNNELVWGQIVSIAIEADPVALTKQIKIAPTIYELVADYKNATQWMHDNHPEKGRHRLPAPSDLDEFMEKAGGLGWSRYKHFIRRCKEVGIDRTLDDIRHIAGFDKLNRPKAPIRDRGDKPWDKDSVLDAYLAAWESIGLDQDPPSDPQLAEISRKQSQCLNPDGTLNIEKAIEEKLPTVFVPRNSRYAHYNVGIIGILNDLEKERGIKIEIKDKGRVKHLATNAIKAGLNETGVPKQIFNEMNSRLISR